MRFRRSTIHEGLKVLWVYLFKPEDKYYIAGIAGRSHPLFKSSGPEFNLFVSILQI